MIVKEASYLSLEGRRLLEILMATIDDYCKRHPFDNLYDASAALVDELRQ
jgi:hypothetical protein